ncbi:hypothetical protein C815_01314 [Firmicutes bacterium M10-2]|nr:hypothetical protein C815_01314 [Firmicutes bacterium M10-2]
MKIALLDVDLLEEEVVKQFFQERNIACAIVSGMKPAYDRIGSTDLIFQDELAVNEYRFRSVPYSLIIFDTRSRYWKRYYFHLFSDEETDAISVLAEKINQEIDRFNMRNTEFDQ